MWNKRKQLVALTAVAGLLVLPTTNAFAQSISPFGKGNPIQSLSEQLDRLESRVKRIDSLEKRIGELENPPIPTSLSGSYNATITSYCLQAIPKFGPNFTTPPGTGVERFYEATTATYRYNKNGTMENEAFAGLHIDSNFLRERSGGGGSGCTWQYTPINPTDGTFTQWRDRCTASNGRYNRIWCTEMS